MSKSKKWFYSFLSNWEESKERKIGCGTYASNLTELYKLCEVDMGKSWAKRVYRTAFKHWEVRQNEKDD